QRLNDIVGSAYYVAPKVLHRSYNKEAGSEAMLRINLEMGDIYYLDLYIPQCVPAIIAHPPTHQPHPYQGYFRIHVPNLQKDIGASLAHFLYSGDTDPCVPSAGTIYSLESMGLDVIEPWQKWMLPNTTKVAGMKIFYDGITYGHYIACWT
ncbi:putative serine carboxypeptidase-like protein 23, partial [Tanacetum coccineum]